MFQCSLRTWLRPIIGLEKRGALLGKKLETLLNTMGGGAPLKTEWMQEMPWLTHAHWGKAVCIFLFITIEECKKVSHRHLQYILLKVYRTKNFTHYQQNWPSSRGQLSSWPPASGAPSPSCLTFFSRAAIFLASLALLWSCSIFSSPPSSLETSKAANLNRSNYDCSSKR